MVYNTFFGVVSFVAPMEVNSVSEKCLTGTLDNFGGSSTIEGSPYGKAFGNDALRFASHEEIYMVEGFG
jgi:hypothetical protein